MVGWKEEGNDLFKGVEHSESMRGVQIRRSYRLSSVHNAAPASQRRSNHAKHLPAINKINLRP